LEKEIIASENQRLDKLITSVLQSPRNQIEKLIKDGNVKVNNKVIKKCGHKLDIDDKIEIDYPKLQEEETKEVDFDIEIIYEDDDILVINKPANLVTHPAPSVKDATIVDWLIHKNINLSTINGENRHGIVHRLDKDTTGVMVVAKNNEAHTKLSEQLQDKSMGRYYIAVINLPLKDHIMIDKPLARNRANRMKMGYAYSGKIAKSAFCKIGLAKNERIELIGAKLFTGRTHQIRAHLEMVNRKIIGDTMYGEKIYEMIPNDNILLHSFVLYLIHPTTNEKVFFTANPSENFKNYLDTNFHENIYEKGNQDNIIKLFQESFS
jgi:23S rRNA pseudouridine1911/1915/1917 synthase